MDMRVVSDPSLTENAVINISKEDRRAHGSHQKAFTSKWHYCLLFSYYGEEKGLYLFFIRGSNGIKIKEYRNLTRSLQLAVGCAGMGQVHAQPLRPAQIGPHWLANEAWGDHSCLSENSVHLPGTGLHSRLPCRLPRALLRPTGRPRASWAGSTLLPPLEIMNWRRGKLGRLKDSQQPYRTLPERGCHGRALFIKSHMLPTAGYCMASIRLFDWWPV